MQNIWEYWNKKVWNSVDISVQDAELLTYPFCQQYKEESKEANAKHLSGSPLYMQPVVKGREN